MLAAVGRAVRSRPVRGNGMCCKACTSCALVIDRGAAHVAPVHGALALQLSRRVSQRSEEQNGGASAGEQPAKPPGIWKRALTWLEGVLPSTSTVAPGDVNRWMMVPPAVATHLCLGSVFAWSLFNDPLSRELGVVAACSSDWHLGSIVPVFSTVLALHGLTAAAAGLWQQRAGVRASNTLGALCWGGGLMLGGAGVYVHSLPLLYAGFGLLGGIGQGLAYVPPIATLIRWFPDKKGLAGGLTIMGFGGGALLFAPVISKLLDTFKKAPEYLGTLDGVNCVMEGGKRLVNIDGKLREAVLASSADLANSGFEHLDPGLYAVGSGSTGAAATLAILGGTYFATMMASALMFKVPTAVSAATADGGQSAPAVVEPFVPVERVMKTPQFWKLWLTFGCVSASGMALVSVASTMMREIFAPSLPMIVTAAFATSYVSALSLANLAGRLGWAALSDRIGCKNTFAIFTGASVPIFLAVPTLVKMVTDNPSALPLALFVGSTMMTFSFFGGAYATCPAYESSLFGSKNVGAVHGRMLTASATASVAGPMALTAMRQSSMDGAVHDLAAQVDSAEYKAKFGTSLESMLESKSATIAQLLEIAPDTVADPTPFLYDSTMYTAAAMLSVATIANLSMRPTPRAHQFVDVDGEEVQVDSEEAKAKYGVIP